MLYYPNSNLSQKISTNFVDIGEYENYNSYSPAWAKSRHISRIDPRAIDALAVLRFITKVGTSDVLHEIKLVVPSSERCGISVVYGLTKVYAVLELLKVATR
jgi:hypothetical protein